MAKTPKEKGYFALGYITDSVVAYELRELQKAIAKKTGIKPAMAQVVLVILKRGLKGL